MDGNRYATLGYFVSANPLIFFRHLQTYPADLLEKNKETIW